jgi:DUF917 family protein
MAIPYAGIGGFELFRGKVADVQRRTEAGFAVARPASRALTNGTAAS